MGKPDKATLKKEGLELKSVVATARKKTLNFAILQGKDGMVLETDFKKPPSFLRKLAKKNGGGPKGMQGTLRVEGKTLVFSVEEEAPSVFSKLIRTHFAQRGQTMGVSIIVLGSEPLAEASEGQKGDEAWPSTEVSGDHEQGSTQQPVGSNSAAEPVYGYTNQEDAKAPYFSMRKAFNKDFAAVKKAPSPSSPMEHLKTQLDGAGAQMDQSEGAEDFIKSLDQVRSARLDLDRLISLAKDPDRIKWFGLSAKYSKHVDALKPSSVPAFAQQRNQASVDRDSVFSEAKSGHYSAAVLTLERLEAGLLSYDANLATYNTAYSTYLTETRRFESEFARLNAYPYPSNAMKALRNQISDQAEVIYRYGDAYEYQDALGAISDGFVLIGELLIQSEDPSRLDYLALLPGLDRWLMNTMNKNQGDLGKYFEEISTKNSEMHDAAEAGLYKEALSLGWEIKTLLEQLELNLSELKLYDEYMFRLSILQPELGEAIDMVEGEEYFATVAPLRKRLQELVAKGDELILKRDYGAALSLVADIQDAMIKVTAEIDTIETKPHSKEVLPQGTNLQQFAKDHSIDLLTLILVNHELIKKRGNWTDIQPGDTILVPDPDLQFEMYQFDGETVILSKKDRIKLEAQLKKRALHRFNTYYMHHFEALEGIYQEQKKNNDSFVGRCIVPYASTTPHKSYRDAKSALETVRKSIESESYGDMQKSLHYLTGKINEFGTDLNKWRSEIFGAGASAIGALVFVRDLSITFLATLATGPMTVGASMTKAAVINGLTNAGAGLVINIVEAGTDVATEQKIDWGNVIVDGSFDLAFDFISGAAVERFLAIFKPIFGNRVTKNSSNLVRQWVVKDMMSSKGVLNVLVDVDQSIIADAVLDVAGGWVLSRVFDNYWKQFQKLIVMDVLKTDGKKDIDMGEFAELVADRVSVLAPEMYDGIFKAAVIEHGPENLVPK